MARENITFQCTECKRKNYTGMKNKKTSTTVRPLEPFAASRLLPFPF